MPESIHESMPESSIWGTWVRVYCDACVELRILQIQKGGFSSPHCHHTKANVFHVARGRVKLRMWVQDDQVVEHLAAPEGQPPCVPAGVMHQFHALEDSVVYEISVAESGRVMDPDEIERHGPSGVQDSQ